MTVSQHDVLPLVFPQWQGGNNPLCYLGSQLLNWLAPEPEGPVAYVDVVEPDGEALALERGIAGRHVLLRQARQARQLIDRPPRRDGV